MPKAAAQPQPTVAETLDALAERAAFVQQWARMAATDVDFLLYKNAINGVGEVCGDVEQLALRVKASLDNDALDTELQRPR